MHDEIADSVNAEDVHKIVRVDDIALGLGHLFTALQQPGVAEDLFGKRHAQSHQEDRPVDGVETDDVLADQMKVGGPVLIKERITVAVGIVAQAGDIVAQRIEPHIDDVTGREIDRDAPGEGGARDTQILQTGLQEVVDHLVLTALRLNELGMLLDVLHQLIRILAHLKEVGFFFRVHALAAAVRALAVLQLALGPERLTGSAVLTFVLTLIDVTLLVHPAEDLLHLGLVLGIGGADEAVIGGVHQVPDVLDLTCHVVHVLLGRDAGGFRLLLDLLTVLVGTGLEVDVVAGLALVTGDGVCQHDLIGIADVGLCGSIGNGGCDVIGFFLCHNISSFVKKKIALANKETLVAGGSLVTKTAKEYGVDILPVDSEHSAIFQCLRSGDKKQIKKILLTASGGPFYGMNSKELESVTLADALKHPNWSMGAKITIDSATLMNKGLELIEAAWLFDKSAEEIEIVVHRESVIHSLVEFADNSVLAQLGVPDMKIPIQYALTYPDRYECPVKRLSLTDYGKLTFFKPDIDTFLCLKTCIKALDMGGLAPCAANGANEQAVAMFLNGEISFLDIGRLVELTVNNVENKDVYSLEDVLSTDAWAREFVKQAVSQGVLCK